MGYPLCKMLITNFASVGSRGARIAGASRVIGIDMNPNRFESGMLFEVHVIHGVISFSY